MTVIIANIIDFVASLLQVGSDAIKKKSKLLAVQTVQLLLQGISMLLVGGITGAISNVLSCYRNYLCSKEKLNRVWKGILIAASVAMTVFFNTQGWLGVIPVAVCTVYILLMDVKDPIKFKLLVTLSFVPWIVYHFVLQLYVAAIFDAASVISSAVTLFLMMRGKETRDVEGVSNADN
ncbi:MAG: YgjV family protein [Clostridia bacterium]|nr:YgjV family protein [Clostridia bacterium]